MNTRTQQNESETTPSDLEEFLRKLVLPPIQRYLPLYDKFSGTKTTIDTSEDEWVVMRRCLPVR